MKPGLVRIDDDWEEWKMSNLIDSLLRWLRRNKVEDSNTKQTSDRRRKRENSLFTQRKDMRTIKVKRPLVAYFVNLSTGMIRVSLV